MAIGAFVWMTLQPEVGLLDRRPDSAGDTAPYAAAGNGQLGSNDSDTTALDATVVRAEVGTTAIVRRPLPDDAEWVRITVVDRDTDAPIPGARVLWSDETVWKHLGGGRNEFFTSDEGQRLLQAPERLAERGGWETIADERGEARVTLRENTEVIGMHDGRYGLLSLATNSVPPPQGHRLRLQPDLAITVRVVDDREQPCADVPLHVAPHDDQGVQLTWDRLAHAITDADGNATIRHLQQLHDKMRRSLLAREAELPRTTATPVWRVRTRLAVDRDRGVAFAIDAPPTEPVVLRLGPTGSIRARSIDGPSATAFRNATLIHDQREEGPTRLGLPRFQRSARPDPDGFVRWRHLPLGQRFFIHTNTGIGTEVTGPRLADQEIEVILQPETGAVVLRGRALGPDRQPLVDTNLLLRGRGPRTMIHVEPRTDAEGRFLVQATTTDQPLELEALCLMREYADEEPWRLDLPPRTIRPGTEDLGDLVLAPGPILASGHLFAGDEPFVGNVWVRLEREETREDKIVRPRWRTQEDVQQRLHGNQFILRGAAPAGRYRLSVHGDHNLPITPVEIRLGQTDVVIRLDRGARLAASALLPENAPTEALLAELIAAERDPKTGAPRRHPADLEAERGERHQLRWGAVPPGTYTLELRLDTGTAPLASIAAVVVPPPPGGDPRLVDIDLRAMVRIVQAEVVTADGKPAEDADGMVFPIGLQPDSVWPGHRFWQPRWRMLLPAAAITVLVGVLDHRPQQLTVSGDRLTIPAEPWPEVQISIADLPAALADARFEAHLQPIETPRGTVRHRWGEGKLQEWMVPQRHRQLRGGSGALPIADGPHRLQLWLGLKTGTVSIPVASPTSVRPNAGKVTVAVAPAEWAKVLEKLSAGTDDRK
ncbi:MAG: hypothetical protein MUC36_00380 [Planctomycetes bacterium]|nr:hypothetical protein [Planctomycetota bacterium]